MPYQVGSFAVGNRLLPPEQRTAQADAPRANAITSGHRACQGCGEVLGARYALDAAVRAAQGRLIAANATSCLEVFSTPYPESSWRVPWLHSLFGNAPAVATGMAAALKAQGRIGSTGARATECPLTTPSSRRHWPRACWSSGCRRSSMRTAASS